MAMTFTSPELVSAALAAAVLMFLILRMPEVGIMAVIVLTSTFFDSEANLGLSLGFGHIYLTDILLFVMLGWIGVRWLMDRGRKLVRTPLDIPLLAFVGIASLSTAIAIFRSSLTIQQSLGEVRSIVNYLFFFVVTQLIRSEKQVKNAVTGLLALAALVAMAMIVQYTLGPSARVLPGRVETLWTEGTTYAGVTRIIPPGYSLIFVAFVFLSVSLGHGAGERLKARFFIPWLLTGLGVVLTFKRHLWAAALVLFLLILYLGRKIELNKIIRWALATLAVLALGVFAGISITGSKGTNFLSSSVSRLKSLTSPETYLAPSGSLRWRDFEYAFAAPQIMAHPVLGLGLGAHYRPFIPHRDHPGFDGRGFIHNSHVWLMVKTGLLGYLAMVGLMTLFVYRGFRNWRTLPTPRARTIVLGFTLAYTGMLIGSVVEPMLIEWHWTTLIAVMMGLNEAVLASAKPQAGLSV
jgi:O-antigen ligase